MVYKVLRNILIWRILLLALTASVTGVLLGQKAETWMITIPAIMTVLMLIALVRHIQQPYRKLHYYIEAIKNDDTSTLFSDKTGNPFLNDLHSSLNKLNQIIQEKSIRVRMAERYFSEILEHIDTAVLVFNEKEFVLNRNKAALQLLGLSTLTHLRQLDKVDGGLRKLLISPDTLQEHSIQFSSEKESLQLVVRSTAIRLRDETVTLVTMQDIKGELERKELESWLKLIRVLNHEIMNSLTPVTSIAQSLGELWKSTAAVVPQSRLVDQTINGLNAIEERGEALMRFIESYRQFSRMPDLELRKVSLSAFFDRLSILISPLKEQSGAAIHFVQPDQDFEASMDEQLMVQVIINLIKNSLHAVKDSPEPTIEILCKPLGNGSSEIRVVDNGVGISDDIRDEIFVPFFTTKQDGNGIGLSYSRQIMRAHKGSISCKSGQARTEFILKWRMA